MAIGFSLPGIPGQIRGTAEEAGAVPDLGQAMMQGFRSNLENIQGAPRLLAQKLVSNQLANTINKAKADYAQRMAQTGYEQALADLQNRNLINQYYPRMRESELKSAGLSQAHQQMVNQFYPDLIKSQLSGAALTQDQQRMVNEQLRRDMAIKQAKQDIIQKALARGASIQQATQLAEEQTQNLPSISEIAQSPEMQNYMTALQQGVAQQPQMQEAAGYTPIPEQENIFAPEYGQGYDTGSFYDQQMLEALRQNAIAQELSPYMQVQPVLPSMIQPRGFTPKPQEFPELQPYAESLAQAAPSYLAQPEVAQQQAPRSYAEQLKQQGYNTDRMIPELAALDNEYISNPAVRDEIEKQYPGTGIKREKDFPRDRFITTTTLPSGATKTEIQSLGNGAGGEGGAAAPHKAQSPIGKMIEDFKYYTASGDLESAKEAKQAIDNALTKDKKTQTEFNKAYEEWENTVKKYGPDSQKAKDYGARVASLIRGSVIRSEPKPPANSTWIYDENENLIGYEIPPTKEDIAAKVNPVGFNELFPYISEGVKPYQGTLGEVNAQIKNDLKNQDIDQGAANRLRNWLISGKLLTSTAAREIGMLNAPKVKNVLSDLKSALGPTNMPVKTLFPKLEERFKYYESKIHKNIQNDAQDKFGVILKMVNDKIEAAREEAKKQKTFVPTKKTGSLSQLINQGSKTVKAKQKLKPIKLMPNAAGNLEVVKNG